jgi:hypothetical protein
MPIFCSFKFKDNIYNENYLKSNIEMPYSTSKDNNKDIVIYISEHLLKDYF